MHKLLLPYYKADEPGGVVLVAKNGEVVYRQAFGLAHMELSVPVRDNTVFYIGSNTKQFTAVAVLQLVEKGSFRLQDTLGALLPSCPYPASGITVQQLLSHTSGLGSNTETPSYRSVNRKGVSPKELVQYFINLPPDFVHGTKWAYNNANYCILGHLIEQSSGQSYADYLAEHIFKPSAMMHSRLATESDIIKNRPAGYTNFRLGIKNVAIANHSALFASGDILSTADDMLQWNKALNSGRLLKPETSRLLYTPQILANGTRTAYGMGFHLQELHGSPALRHGGLVEGFTSETLYLPSEDVYVLILLNQETSKVPIVPLTRILAGIAIGKPYSFEEKAITETELREYVGVYENSGGEFVNISTENGKLKFQRPNGTRYMLRYAGKSEFFFDRDFLRAEFDRDANGAIKSFRFSAVDIGVTEWRKQKRALLKLSAEKVADSTLKQYPGRYVSVKGDTVFITRDGASLYLRIGNQPKTMLAAESVARFAALREDVFVVFDSEKGVERLYLWLTQGRNRNRYTKL